MLLYKYKLKNINNSTKRNFSKPKLFGKTSLLSTGLIFRSGLSKKIKIKIKTKIKI
jgi:hypothetical protein